MKIAVTYDEQTGEVFQHFGHSDAFKIYEFGESGLTGAMVLNTSAINGHEAMASFLAKDCKISEDLSFELSSTQIISISFKV